MSVDTTQLLAVPVEGPLSASDALLLVRYRAALSEMSEQLANKTIERNACAAEMDRAHAELRATRTELAGAHGEIMGLKVTAGFFERRCEVLEAAAKRPLTKPEQDSLSGCCPFCGVTVQEYFEQRERAHLQEIQRLDGVVAKERETVRRLSIVVNAAKRWSHARDHIEINLWSAREIDLQHALAMLDGEEPKHCQCTHEEGDSVCEVHPGCDECGEQTNVPTKWCKDHAPLANPRGHQGGER